MEQVLRNQAHRILNDYCMNNGINANGTDRQGAILVDGKNRQTTFFLLHPNDKEA